ncbi:hypothetical protein K7432_000858 [Basidiobolus ranarum]|uniref:NAD(P)-binding protein n=1 Tax=Basidiobolus ranarum TaxID=34480 RepID=A0ABR2WAI7_9FUNG
MVYSSIRDLGLAFFTVSLGVLQIPIMFALTFIDILRKATSKKIRPRQIVITGGSSGIGEALALEYARPGVILHLIARSRSRLEMTEVKCKQLGCSVYLYSVDVTNSDVLRKTLLDIYEDRPIDLLIASAGQAGDFVDTQKNDSLTPTSWETMYDRMFDVNVIGVMNTVMPIFNKMKSSGYGGQIAIIGSVAGYLGPPNMIYYNASKAAVNSFARDLRHLGQENGVYVSLVVPGLIKSRLTLQLDAPYPQTYPFFGSPQILAQEIKSGLSRNDSIISYPDYQYFGVYGVSTLVPTVKQWITWFVGLTGPMGTKMS